MQEGGPVVPSKEEFEAMSPKEKAARKKEPEGLAEAWAWVMNYLLGK